MKRLPGRTGWSKTVTVFSFLAGGVLMIPGASPVGAAGAGEGFASAYQATRETGPVSLNVYGVPLPEVLGLVAEQAGLVLVSVGVPEIPVTLHLENVSAEDALRLIFAGTPYDGFVVGNHLRVVGAEEATTRNYSLQRAHAGEMSVILTETFDGLAVAPDLRTNSVTIRGIPADLRMAEDLLLRLDARVPQVLIRADIIEVNLGDDWELGVNLRFDLDQTEDGVNQSSTLRGDPLTSVTDFAISYARLGTNEFRAFLGTMQEVVDSRILSSPRVVTASGRTAEILVGERVPYPRATTETQTGGTLEEIEFVDVGVRLQVTPRVSEDGLITMLVHPEVSEVLDTAVQGIPRIGTREATTEVMIRDGETLVIGGLKRKTRTETIRRLPLLGSLPLVGALFRSTRVDEGEVELLVFLTPVLVDEALATTGQGKRDARMRELGVHPGDW